MRGCDNCRSSLGLITATVRPDPCAGAYWAWQNNPTFLNKVRFNLCLVEHKAGQYILDLGHWIWAELDALWQELKRAGNVLASGMANAISAAGNAVLDSLNYVSRRSKELLNWLVTQFEHAAMAWLAISGLVLGALWFFPEVLEMGASKYGQHVAHKVTKGYQKGRAA